MTLREAIDWGKLASLRLEAKLVADGVYAGAHRSVRRGAGIEFGGHRNYLPGDDLRFLDRHARMRHGVLLVREFETETDRALRLIVDASASMSYRGDEQRRSKYDYAALLAAALGRVALTHGDRVALDFVAGGPEARPVPAAGGRDAFERLTGHLESATASGAATLEAFERALAPTLRHARRGAAVVLFSDLLDLPDGAAELTAALCSGGRALCVVRVLDRDELEFPFEGAVALRAMEGDGFVETDAGAVRAEYLRRLQALHDDWEARLVRRGARLVSVSSSDDALETVRRILFALAQAGAEERGHA
ncbi:MAG: DUF58 domain-containing protein [Polyangiaceae bacterium]